MVTKETKNFETIAALRERERESLNLSQLGFDKYAQNHYINENNNSKIIEKNASDKVEDVAFNNIKLRKKQKIKKDRLASSRCEEQINLLHDSLSFL